MEQAIVAALAAVIVALFAGLTALSGRRDTREGDFRDDYLERLDKAEARADALYARLSDLDSENANLRREVAALRRQVERMEVACPECPFRADGDPHAA